MELKLEKKFTVPVPAAVAWNLLADIEAVASCMPGVQVTDKVDETHYKGLVKLKVGPINASFKGEAEIQQLDPEQHVLQVVGKGSEASGTSAASMHLSASVRDLDDGRCEVSGVSKVNVSGKLAQLGARVANEVANQLFVEFAENFTRRASEMASSKTLPSEPKSRPAEAPVSTELNLLSLLKRAIVRLLRRIFTFGRPRDNK